MHAASFLTALLLGASSAAAAAVEARGPAIFTSITLFDNVGRTNTSGESRTFDISTGGSCLNLQSEALDNRASSVTVPSGYNCTLYDNYNCSGANSGPIFAPGRDNLDDFNQFDDRTSSFACDRVRR